MLRVRGAPAIGIAAAYGSIVSLKTFVPERAVDEEVISAVNQAIDYLANRVPRPSIFSGVWLG